MNLSLSAHAERDLSEIVDGLAWTNPQSARAFHTQLSGRLDQLLRLPEMGRPRPDIDDGLRSLLVSPYIIFYRISREEITVIRILHGSRDLRQSIVPGA